MDVDAALLMDDGEDLGNVHLNVGVIGRAGVGKTEFIRAIVGDGTTATVSRQRRGTPYVHPTLPSVFFWELRHVENPADESFVDEYDFFLMLCDTEFRETEIWLAEQFVKRKKGFFFVRTKIDKVIPDPSSMDEIPITLFQEISSKFAKYPTFAISNSRASGFDFPKLKKQLYCALISLKRLASVGSGKESVGSGKESVGSGTESVGSGKESVGSGKESVGSGTESVGSGKESVEKYLESKLDEWKDAKIEVAIVGETGSGKSSLTNAIRNLKPSDPGAAKVGVTETTVKPTWFSHPDNKNIRFWDLPGVGSPSCAKKIYLKKIDVDLYDVFVIVSARRFTDNDRWLVEELGKREKSYFLVRTKFDDEVGNGNNKENIRDKIIQDIKQKINLPDIRIYLLSNVNSDMYDFPQLLEDLFHDLPSVKQESLALTLTGYSEGIIEMKKKTLKSRIWKAAIMSGGAGAVPVPGIDMAVDLGIFVHETNLYRQTFGLNEASLRQLAEEFHLDTDRLRSAMANTGAMSLTRAGIRTAIVSGRTGLALATKTGVTSVLEVAVPVVGSMISGGVSFLMALRFLNKMLDDFASDAMAVYRLCAEKVLADNTRSIAESE